MKNEKDMREWLKLYDAPDISEVRINKLISTGKAYMDSAEFNNSSMRHLLLGQLRYIPASFWVVQIASAAFAAVFICLFGYWKAPFRYLLTILMITIPLVVLVGAREISKSRTYDMWEIEQSCRCQLAKITASRMAIVGFVDLFLITDVLAITNFYCRRSMIEIILYGMVPFNLSCICYLFTMMKNKREGSSYHLIVCMICLSAVFSIALRQEFLFESSMLWVWAISYLFSLARLGKTIQKYLGNIKMIGESAWSLL